MEGSIAGIKKAAVETVLSLIEPGASIGWGGSASIRELGILAELEKSGHEMRDYPMKDKETDGKSVLSRLLQCRLFPLWERMQSL